MAFIDPLTFAGSSYRIISTVPSQTELLYTLGLGERVVGITKFCVHPAAWFTTRARVGGTKTLNVERIRQLQPDLIIANKEENEQEQVEALAAEFPVYMSDIYTLDDAYGMMRDVGLLVGKPNEAEQLIATISGNLEKSAGPTRGLRVLYLIWRKPWMAAGQHTFINAMLRVNGWENALATARLNKDPGRYPELETAELTALNPDVILLSSEPYPFAQRHIGELQEICQQARILLVDGELFSWYGSRLKFSTAHFRALRERMRYF